MLDHKSYGSPAVLPFRSSVHTDTLAHLVDDTAPLYAVVERTGPGWEGTEAAVLDALRASRDAVASLAGGSAHDRRAVAACLEEAVDMAKTQAALAAQGAGERPAPTSVQLATLTDDTLLVARSGAGNVVVLREHDAHPVFGGAEANPLVANGSVVAFDLATADLVLLASAAIDLGLSPARWSGIAARSLEDAVAAVVGFSLVPGFPVPHAVLAVRVTRGRDAATIRRRTDLLRSLPLLQRFTHGEQLALAPYLSLRRWRAGAPLWAAGDQADALLILLEGDVEVQRASGVVEGVGAGFAIGESALAGGARRAFSAAARGDVEALVLRSDDFEALCGRRPELALRLCRTLLGAVVSRSADFRWFLDDASA